MSTRTRTTAAAIALTAAVIGTAVLGASGSATAATPAATAVPHGVLTISNGTKYVLINGRQVNFGVIVRDIAWSPDGAKAAFVDGSGSLNISNPDGSGRVLVAKNPGSQNWNHPTWQVAPADPRVGVPAKNNIVFAAITKGVSRLDYVSAKAVRGTPKALPLHQYNGPNEPALPQTGNAWPAAGGTHGTSVYANAHTGDVYIRDDYIRQQGGVLARGSEPALSPDEAAVVFVRAVSGRDHIFVENLKTGATKDITPHAATNYTEPAWSSDSSTLAVRTPTGTVTMPANGTHAPVKATSVVGLASYRR